MTDFSTSHRRWLVWTLRIAVLVLVCLGVRGTVSSALDDLSQHDWRLRPEWLFASGALYVIGLVPMAWYWHRALASLGQPAPWPAVVRAYYFGHLGKYVPGKALAIILRVAAVRKWVPSIRIAIVSSLLETLAMMSVGAFLAAALSIVLRLELWLVALGLAMAVAVGLPTLPPVARWLARIGVARLKQPTDEDELHSPPIHLDMDASLQGINLRLLATGWLAASVCWLLLGLSLWTTLRSIGVVELDPLSDLPVLVAAVAFAVVAGFASMLPGGLGVRDLLLMELLAPQCGSANALVATVLMRLVWLVSELAACVILYIAAKLRSMRGPPLAV